MLFPVRAGLSVFCASDRIQISDSTLCENIISKCVPQENDNKAKSGRFFKMNFFQSALKNVGSFPIFRRHWELRNGAFHFVPIKCILNQLANYLL